MPHEVIVVCRPNGKFCTPGCWGLERHDQEYGGVEFRCKIYGSPLTYNSPLTLSGFNTEACNPCLENERSGLVQRHVMG